MRREREAWTEVTASILAEMISSSAKVRHEIDLDGGRIRALYGHSIDGRVTTSSVAPPPEFLWHGTSPDSIGSIMIEGLRPMSRQDVHLSPDPATAKEVGRRRSTTPVLLRVRAGEAALTGLEFHRGNGLVWITTSVPPQFIDFPST